MPVEHTITFRLADPVLDGVETLKAILREAQTIPDDEHYGERIAEVWARFKVEKARVESLMTPRHLAAIRDAGWAVQDVGRPGA